MRIMTMLCALMLTGAAATGCAGGWRYGAEPGHEAAGSGAATSAPATASSAGSASAAGATFVWKGEGSSVHVAGAFNEWSTSADPLAKQADGSWTLTKKLAPGRYGYKFVIDGTTWKEDPNAKETVDDGYGGKNSLLVVGAGAPAPVAAPVAPKKAAAGAGSVTLSWKGPAQGVHLAGDFNDWSTSADPLAKQADGTWTISKKLAPGRYAYKFVIDGTNWKEDPNAKETVDDGYGGKNSLLVVGTGAATAASPAAATPSAAAGGPGKGRAPEATAAGVRFFLAGAHRSVHLAGDFNGWSTTTDPLAVGADGLWTIVKKLEPGTYGYKFVIDGSTWKQDEANPETVDDGFGGKNSMIIVK